MASNVELETTFGAEPKRSKPRAALKQGQAAPIGQEPIQSSFSQAAEHAHLAHLSACSSTVWVLS